MMNEKEHVSPRDRVDPLTQQDGSIGGALRVKRKGGRRECSRAKGRERVRQVRVPPLTPLTTDTRIVSSGS